MNKARISLLCCALALLLLSSCATITVRTSEHEWEEDVYPATQQDAEWIFDEDIHIVGRVLMVADWPISIVTDTVLLPYDWFW